MKHGFIGCDNQKRKYVFTPQRVLYPGGVSIESLAENSDGVNNDVSTIIYINAPSYDPVNGSYPLQEKLRTSTVPSERRSITAHHLWNAVININWSNGRGQWA